MDRVERYTYHFHVRAALAEGVFTSVLWTATDVAAKNLHAGWLEIMLLSMAPGVVQLLSLFVASHFASVDRRKLLIGAAFLGRLPLVVVLFSHDIWVFLALVTLQSFSQVPVTAVWNALLRANYTDAKRGTLYGRASQYSSLLAGVGAIGAGIWLDRDPEAVRWIYPVAAVFGVWACWLFARVQVRPGFTAAPAGPDAGALFTVREVLVKDRDFRVFEIGFFLYGLAFMAGATALPLLAANDLALSNTQMLGARALFGLCLMLGTPFMGRVMDRVGPARMAARCYVILLIFSVVVLHTTDWRMYLLGQVIYGFAMSGVHIAWNMGPITLAPARDAARYMGVHMALVGVRAMLGHPVGGLVIALTAQPRYVFFFSLVFFGTAAWVMWRLANERDARTRVNS